MGAKEVGWGLNQWEKKYGRPRIICANASSINQSEHVKIWCKQRGVQIEFSPPYHHGSIGVVERFNQTLLNRFRRMWAEVPGNFAQMVRKVVGIYNDTPINRKLGTPNEVRKGGPIVWRNVLNMMRRNRTKANRLT